MIASIEGTVTAVTAESAVIKVGGVGYRVFCGPNTLAALTVGKPVELHIHHLVREDAQALYGFRTPEELACFELLTTVSGVGPKVGLAIVSSRPVADLQLAILQGDEAVLTAKRPRRFTPPASGPWLDTTSLAPAGPVVMPEHEPVELRVRASPGASVSLLLPDGSRIPFAPESSLEDVPWGIRAFGRDTSALARSVRNDRYVALVTELALAGDSVSAASMEVVLGRDTLRRTWPLSLMR